MIRVGVPLSSTGTNDEIEINVGDDIIATTPIRVESIWRSSLDSEEVWVKDFYGNVYIVSSKHRIASVFEKVEE